MANLLMITCTPSFTSSQNKRSAWKEGQSRQQYDQKGNKHNDNKPEDISKVTIMT